MDILNQIPEPYYKNEDERVKDALKYFDILLPSLPDYSAFMYHDKVREYLISVNHDNTEFRKLMEIQQLMEDILIKEGFADRLGNSYEIELNKNGRVLKQQGSLKKYNEYEQKGHTFNIKEFKGSLNTGNVGKDLNQSFEDKSLTADAINSTPIKKSKIDVPLILKITAGIIAIALAVLKGCNLI